MTQTCSVRKVTQCLKIVQKSRIQHCEQSGQNVLPDKSILIGQNRQN